MDRKESRSYGNQPTNMKGSMNEKYTVDRKWFVQRNATGSPKHCFYFFHFKDAVTLCVFVGKQTSKQNKRNKTNKNKTHQPCSGRNGFTFYKWTTKRKKTNKQTETLPIFCLIHHSRQELYRVCIRHTISNYLQVPSDKVIRRHEEFSILLHACILLNEYNIWWLKCIFLQALLLPLSIAPNQPQAYSR